MFSSTDEPVPGAPSIILKKAALLGGQLTRKFLPWLALATLAGILTFMIAASGLSLPEFVVLSRILQPRMVALFIAATLVVYMLVGFGFLWL